MIKFYFCNTCGNLIEKVKDSGINPYCCSKPMEELRAASTDGDKEKHVPVIKREKFCEGLCKVRVDVGAAPHPMEDTHHIQFITLETDKGSYRKSLTLLEEPYAEFYIPEDEKIIAAYDHCNIHGLWTAQCSSAPL